MSSLEKSLSSDEALHDKDNLLIWETANQRIERAKKQPIPLQQDYLFNEIKKIKFNFITATFYSYHKTK